MIKACIFDLDGTLAYTLDSMAVVGNEVVRKYGLKPMPIENYRYYCGNGADMLVKRLLVDAGDPELLHYEEARALYRKEFDKETFKEILPYCLNIFSFSIFQFSFYNLRPVFLGMQGSLDSVADYRVLNGIIGIVSMFGGIFMGVLLPSTSKIVAQGNAEAYYKVAYDGTKYISIVLCFCTFGMMTVGSEVITMYVGESFLYLIPWFNIWLLCTLGVHNQAISSLILSGSDIRAITYNTSISSIIGLIVAWFLIPYFEIGGVVIAFAIYIIVQLSFYYLYYWPKKMNIQSGRVFLYSFFPFVMIGVGATVLIDLLINLDGKIVSSFFLKGILFTIIYSIVCFRFLNKEDKKIRTPITHTNRKNAYMHKTGVNGNVLFKSRLYLWL